MNRIDFTNKINTYAARFVLEVEGFNATSGDSDERDHSNPAQDNIGEMDWISDVNIRITDTGATISVVFDYPTDSEKPQRYSKVEITLSRIAGIIGFAKQEVKPIFYRGHTTDPDYRLKFGID
ncbi:hypothetical protein ACEN9X_14655 [Mucilaginibacter sp. Mucisp86]|uniref:hypothetical protein n=1 Tax=Mucilaginibacter sp. Mucisp86 TaxID=3243060 RepID=UPI0039B65A91